MSPPDARGFQIRQHFPAVSVTLRSHAAVRTHLRQMRSARIVSVHPVCTAGRPPDIPPGKALLQASPFLPVLPFFRSLRRALTFFPYRRSVPHAPSVRQTSAAPLPAEVRTGYRQAHLPRSSGRKQGIPLQSLLRSGPFPHASPSAPGSPVLYGRRSPVRSFRIPFARRRCRPAGFCAAVLTVHPPPQFCGVSR